MRSLFQVWVLDPYTDTVVHQGQYVAKTAEQAEQICKGGLVPLQQHIECDLSELNFVVERRGEENSLPEKKARK